MKWTILKVGRHLSMQAISSRRWQPGALLALAAGALLLSAPAHAQNAVVVQSCGTLPAGAPYVVGQTVLLTIDINGNLCTPHIVQNGNPAGQAIGVPGSPMVVTEQGSLMTICPRNPISGRIPPLC
jgi:hypothetical protein